MYTFKDVPITKIMKESELVRKINSISKKLEKSNILSNCWKLARDKGKGKTEEHRYHTDMDYVFLRDNLKINIDMGYSNKKIKVHYKDNLVLSCDRHSLNKPECKFYPRAGDFCVLTYKSGEWEKQVKEYLINKPKKEKTQKPVKPDVDSALLSDLKKNFDIK